MCVRENEEKMSIHSKRDTRPRFRLFVLFFFFEAEWQHIKFLSTVFFSLFSFEAKLFFFATDDEREKESSITKRDGERE